VLNRIGIDGYVYSRISPSNFLEENYVSKEADDFSFPSKKRNLIYIFMESMEQTYADTEHGGYFEESLIPNLQQLQQEGVTFSDDGYVCSKAASWTVASLVGQTSASPLKTNLLHLNADEMLPGALGIGEVLEEGGYNQVFLLGSPSTFSKRDLYFSQHGNYQIEDYNYAKEQGWIDEDYKVWWGYEDDKLFEFAKLEATRLASSNEPFNLTMLTADTHFYGGYLCEDCPEADTQLESVIRCSDAKVSAFVRWCMEQDWYENTTIVLVGDHVSMDNSWFSDNGASSFNRKVYYTFLNPAQDVTDQSERIFNAYDMFPTTLSALNITWDDDQIGLGTNLFSGEQTLCEIYGAKSLDKKILDCSLWYDKNILN
jgi:phosphoglycerol transferase